MSDTVEEPDKNPATEPAVETPLQRNRFLEASTRRTTLLLIAALLVGGGFGTLIGGSLDREPSHFDGMSHQGDRFDGDRGENFRQQQDGSDNRDFSENQIPPKGFRSEPSEQNTENTPEFNKNNR